MKKIVLSFLMAVVGLTATAQAPAFPGAEGVARLTTTGGRGGRVIHVTNLNDSGTGSLRAACTASGARIVVFDVSGVINLQSQLKITNDNITIEGQTAPGDGICLKNYTFNISANNVIVRFIRSRMGDEKKTEDDAMNAFFHTGGEKSNIIIDHCSISWCTDECGSFYGINNFTLQWCVLSESLRNSIHDKGAHGYGGIWGGKNAAYHHNLLAHHDSRNPRFDHDYVNTLKGPIDYVNNVVYNWGSNSTYGGESANTNNDYKKINMLNNYYKPGPATNSGVKSRFAYFWTSCSNCTSAMGTSTIVPAHVYATGNYMFGNSDVTSNNWSGIFIQSGSTSSIKSDSRFMPEGYSNNLITTHTAENAFNMVTAYAGASYKKDVIDQRIAKESQEGSYTYTGSNGSTGGLIDTQSDVGGWPEYVSKDKLTDFDNDGMPDVWETANGLNPKLASDAKEYTLDSKGWYTNIEVYCNSLVEDLVKAQNASAATAIEEYYPTTTKVDGIPYYDGSTASGGYPEIPGVAGTITWALSSNTNAAYSNTISNFLDANSFTLGSNLKTNGYGTYNGVRFCKIQAQSIEESAGSTNTVTFSFKTKSGYTFKASKIIFTASKIGTNSGLIDAKWIDAGGTISILSGASPNRNSQDGGYYSTYSQDLSTKSKDTDGTCSFVVNIYKLGALNDNVFSAKDMGLANIVINGYITNASTGVSIPVTISPVMSTEYFNIAGQRVGNQAKGIVIQKQRLENGQIVTKKVMK